MPILGVPERLRRAGWADPDQAEPLFQALRRLGVDAHYAELAIGQGPDAVAHLVEHRAEKSVEWAAQARRLVASAAPPDWRSPVGTPPGGLARFRADVESGRLVLDGKPEAVRFYREEDAFGAFSNFAPYPFVVRLPSGRTLTAPTTEHFFQALKFWGSSSEHARAILAAETPKAAATMGRDRKQPMRGDWEVVKDHVMRLAVAEKVRQHPELSALLESTKDAAIVEHAPLDGYWGNAYELGGTGKNMLGRIFEEVRAAQRTGRLDAYVADALRAAGLSDVGLPDA